MSRRTRIQLLGKRELRRAERNADRRLDALRQRLHQDVLARLEDPLYYPEYWLEPGHLAVVWSEWPTRSDGRRAVAPSTRAAGDE